MEKNRITSAPSVDRNSVPRTPTEAMLIAARDWSVKKMGMGVGNGPATECWQAMYDAAPQQVDAVQAVPEGWMASFGAEVEPCAIPSIGLVTLKVSQSEFQLYQNEFFYLLEQMQRVAAALASPSPAVPPEPQCAMCNDSGAVGRHPDDFQECPDCVAARTTAQPDEPTAREALIACLGDDAVTLLAANPDDEMAHTMQEAAAMLEADGAAQGAVPEGWKLVPLTPTHEMVRAACDAMGATQSVRRAIEAAPDYFAQPTDTTAPSSKERSKPFRPLGEAQLYVLRMCNPEWPTRNPDSRAKRVLQSLLVRKMVYENYGQWYIDTAGLTALADADKPTDTTAGK